MRQKRGDRAFRAGEGGQAPEAHGGGGTDPRVPEEKRPIRKEASWSLAAPILPPGAVLGEDFSRVLRRQDRRWRRNPRDGSVALLH